ncbi:MAG: restriction endonuclease [Elusimicrobia bacterium]|nr:restriction endonuclease [Elusimicrobiota bacterium]
MSIPDYQSIMLPFLKYSADKKEHPVKDAEEHLAGIFHVSDEERKKLLASGRQYVFDNRVGWARTYLKKAGLIESPRRAFFKITSLGLDILSKKPERIDARYLRQFPSFVEFQTIERDRTEGDLAESENDRARTPQELIDENHFKIKKDLAQDLLSLVKQNSPRFFERLVVELLLSMGYGGSRDDAGQAIGQSHDGGIDGIIKEDKLGLDVVYLQAKRWENVVGSKEIRNFVGSLVGQKASKGVFITTSEFTKDAVEYVKTIVHKVVLIDGEMLAQLMIDNNIGVSKIITYGVKKIDSDYFDEE